MSTATASTHRIIRTWSKPLVAPSDWRTQPETIEVLTSEEDSFAIWTDPPGLEKTFTDLKLQLQIIEVLTKTPGLDDVDLAERLGCSPYYVSSILHSMRARGLIEPA